MMIQQKQQISKKGNPKNNVQYQLVKTRPKPLIHSKCNQFWMNFQIFSPRDLPAGLPPQRDVDHRIELVLGAGPPHRAPYRMSPKGLDELK